MADINTIIGNICTGLAQDTAISAWSQAAYARDCTIYENCDPRQAPEEENCPLTIIYHLAKSAALAGPEKQVTIGAAPWVYDADVEEDDDGVIRFPGVRKVEELRQLILTRIVAVVKAMGLSVKSVTTEFNPLTDYPLVSADMEITISQPKTIGSNPYE